MNSIEVLAALNEIAAVPASGKEKLLAIYLDDPLFAEIARWAYDPYITFGITVDQPTSTGWMPFDLTTEWIWDGLQSLADRSLTGNAARSATASSLDELDQGSATLLWRVLSKDLRCGITAKTLNKVRPGFISTFEVMLSQPYEARRIKTFPVAVEPKLDGLRAMCVLQNGEGAFYSRVGNEFPALKHLVEPMAIMLERALARLQNPIPGMSDEDRGVFWSYLGGNMARRSAAIDGEALTGLFNESGAIKRKSAPANAEIHIFDVVPRHALLDHTTRTIGNPHSERRRLVEFLVQHKPDGAPIYATTRYFANSHAEIDRLYEKLRATSLATYLARGNVERERELETILIDKATGLPKKLEGAMVKTLDGPYVKKKGSIWQKIKPEETKDLRILGAYEGEGKYQDQLGGVIVAHPFEGRVVRVNVGGGISDTQRSEWWAMCLRDADRIKHADLPGPLDSDYVAMGCELIGRLLEVEFNEVTPDGSLRHPRAVRFRDDKDPLRSAS